MELLRSGLGAKVGLWESERACSGGGTASEIHCTLELLNYNKGGPVRNLSQQQIFPSALGYLFCIFTRKEAVAGLCRAPLTQHATLHSSK